MVRPRTWAPCRSFTSQHTSVGPRGESPAAVDRSDGAIWLVLRSTTGPDPRMLRQRLCYSQLTIQRHSTIRQTTRHARVSGIDCLKFIQNVKRCWKTETRAESEKRATSPVPWPEELQNNSRCIRSLKGDSKVDLGWRQECHSPHEKREEKEKNRESARNAALASILGRLASPARIYASAISKLTETSYLVRICFSCPLHRYFSAATQRVCPAQRPRKRKIRQIARRLVLRGGEAQRPCGHASIAGFIRGSPPPWPTSRLLPFMLPLPLTFRIPAPAHFLEHPGPMARRPSASSSSMPANALPAYPKVPRCEHGLVVTCRPS